MLRAMHAADNPLTANRRWDCYVEDTAPREIVKRQQCAPSPWALVKGFQDPEYNFVGGVIQSWSKEQAELWQDHTHEYNPSEEIA
jgi:hypothetical protein